MRWAWLRKFPKFVLVFTVFTGSTLLFAFWWFTHSPKRAAENRVADLHRQEDIKEKSALAEKRIDWLGLVDNDLYDLDTGKVIFRNWLKGPIPLKLFFEPESKTFVAQYERGFARYGFDGAEQGSFAQNAPPAFYDDDKRMLYVKDKDIWRANFNRKELRLEDEQKVTSAEQFLPQYFAANIVFGTDKVLVIRNLNRLLLVNLETGNVKPARFPASNFAKQHSPDGQYLVGLENGQFFCYDVEADSAKTIPVGRGKLNDYLWLDNDRCVAIAGLKSVVMYDKKANTLTEIAALPVPCEHVSTASPDRRFVFCSGWKGTVLIDLQSKTAEAIAGGLGLEWVSHDSFIFSREVPDSTLRGTWLQVAGKAEARISPEPYLAGRGGESILSLKSGDLVVLTKHGIARFKPDGDFKEVVPMAILPNRLLGVETWPPGAADNSPGR